MANTGVVYDRRYVGKILAFEPSGGLMNASLVMRDRETDSWWSIITGDAIGGELQGTRLRELPAGEKIQWKDWKARNPHTLVLSVDGREHVDRDPYGRYFSSTEGFRGLSSPDKRLPDKQSIYAFVLDGIAYAAPHDKIEGGAVFHLDGDRQVFLYRRTGSPMFASTFAYVSTGGGKESRFVSRDGDWTDTQTGERFSENAGFPVGSFPASAVERSQEKMTPLARLGGFDTFWYIWSTTHEVTEILE